MNECKHFNQKETKTDHFITNKHSDKVQENSHSKSEFFSLDSG